MVQVRRLVAPLDLEQVFGLLGVGCLLLILLVAGAFLYAYESITMPTDVAAAALSQPSTVYYSDGKPMASFSGNGVSHVILQPSQIPKVMDQAITAAEDRSFYTEGGISITGLARAVYEDLKGGSYLQGGSTLTEQFVKNYYTRLLQHRQHGQDADRQAQAGHRGDQARPPEVQVVDHHQLPEHGPLRPAGDRRRCRGRDLLQ